MKWTREVSRDAHDCVGQHITAPSLRDRLGGVSPF